MVSSVRLKHIQPWASSFVDPSTMHQPGARTVLGGEPSFPLPKRAQWTRPVSKTPDMSGHFWSGGHGSQWHFWIIGLTSLASPSKQSNLRRSLGLQWKRGPEKSQEDDFALRTRRLSSTSIEIDLECIFRSFDIRHPRTVPGDAT